MTIELKPCPCCGVEVCMEPTTGRYKGGYAFCHPGGKTSVKCVMQGGIIFSNLREAQEWADAWNRRVAGKATITAIEELIQMTCSLCGKKFCNGKGDCSGIDNARKALAELKGE